MATEPTATAANREYSPSDTLKPANSMVASLGTGIQADSSTISTKMPSSPSSATTSVATSTMGSVMEATSIESEVG